VGRATKTVLSGGYKFIVFGSSFRQLEHEQKHVHSKSNTDVTDIINHQVDYIYHFITLLGKRP
jgi:hypothetical protein